MYITWNTKKNILIIINCMLAALIILQHHYVFIAFDDYGYASLSYGWTQNSAGMAYTLSDIFKFLSWHYLNWGGRILYFFFEIVILKIGGFDLIQILQAVIIILISMISGKLVATVVKCDAGWSTMIVLMLYGTLSARSLRDGVYWYSASVSYVWPLLPLFGCIYCILLIREKETNFRKCIAVLLTFLAAFSQEQVSVLVIAWITLIILFDLWEQRTNGHKIHIPRYLLYMDICAIIGGMITILALGNFVRADSEIYADFYAKSIPIRLFENAGKILNVNFGFYNWAFTLILTVFCGIAVSIYFKRRSVFGGVCFFAIYYVCEQLITIPLVIGIVIRIVWAACFCVVILVYYYKNKNYLFLSMTIAGMCSQGAMLVSPTIYTRCHTMMEFILHVILAECIIRICMSEEIRRKVVCDACWRLCIVLLSVYAACNFCSITAKYKKNDEINKINHYKLIEAGKRYKIENKTEEITLYQLYDDGYAVNMPYQEGYDFIEVWIKKYYELPDDTYFLWRSMEDDH